MTSTAERRGRGRPKTWPAHFGKEERDRYRLRIKRSGDAALLALLQEDPCAAVAALDARGVAPTPTPAPRKPPVAPIPAAAAAAIDTAPPAPPPASRTPPRAQARVTERKELPLTEELPAEELSDEQAFERAFPNVAAGLAYADAVMAGDEPACKWVRLACERNRRDLERMGTEEFPWVFDAATAEREMRVVQRFKEIKGPRAGHYLRLSPWQQFIHACAFGWLHKDRRTRRFRYVLVYVPRGNGKTTMAAPVGLYMLTLDKEGGAEVYAAAVTRDQARLVFGTAQNMARREPEFLRRYGVEVQTGSIFQAESASTFKPLSRDAQSLDGLNVHFAILDELAQHKTREVHDVLITATGKRSQSMIWAITTAGANQAGIGYEQWSYAKKVLEGTEVDEQFFAILYTIDDGDDWRSLDAMRKANPNWGISVMPDVIETLATRAAAVTAQQNAFKQKHLNVWTNADVAWMDMQVWDSCKDSSLRVQQFEGQTVTIGLDLASRVDIAAKVRLFERTLDGRAHYYLFASFWMPAAAIRASGHAAIEGWVTDGWITECDGDVVDFSQIEESITEDAETFVIGDVAYDPWQAAQMAQNLERHAVPVIEYRPTVANFSAPMKELEALAREGRLHTDGNPVLAWMVSNVVAHMDAKDNIFPRKERPENKIDGVVAAITALGRHMQAEEDEDIDQGFVAI